MDWTEEQKQAINSREKNLLVAAAAGSGKTAVLVERIAQMIIENILNVDEMLIVTFTNAAAQEMRERIYAKIEEKISQETDSAMLERLERQAILLGGASIMTFHSFCLSVIKRNFSKIDLDPKFREADERELNILKQEIIEELFEEKYLQAEKNSDDSFLQFTDNFGGNVHGDTEIFETVLDLHRNSCSRPYPEKWLNSLAEKYENTAAGNKNWVENLLRVAVEEEKKIIDGIYQTCENCVDECYSLEKDFQPFSAVTKIFLNDLEQLKNLKSLADDWDKLYNKLQGGVEFKRFSAPTKLDENLKAKKDFLKTCRDEYKKKFDGLKKIVVKPQAEIFAEIENLAVPVRQLVEITKDFDEKFSAAKRDRGMIDFNDMEHLALKIFNADKKTAENYREKFKMIMVDEYQDTNDVQEEIISKIVGTNNFFAVGDVKQSIYKFRNASPEIFLQKYKSYPTEKNSERIDLSKNFRSRRQVVDSVNCIFKKIMTETAMEIEYDKNAELNFGAGDIGDYPDGENIFDEKTELCIITQEKNSDDEQEISDAESLDKLEREVQVIANKIKFLIESGKKVWDGKEKIYRDITFRDIVILLRSVDGKTSRIIDILAKNKIPAYAEDKGGYFKSPEIQTILNFLNVLDNSRQDIPLAAVMISPLGGFSAENLAQLKIDDRNSDLYTLILNKSDEKNFLGEKCRNFLSKINYWRDISQKISVAELLSKIYRETGYYDYFDNSAGKVAQANLRVLIDRAADYEKTAFRGLSRFIQFIKKIRELKNDMAAARTLGENENLVRIMTIHKSKGLEFPVVFVAQLGNSFNKKDSMKKIVAHRDFGLGICRAIEGENGLNLVSTFPQTVIKKKINLENLAEELRILYVAMTRAREKLFLVGTVSNEKSLTKYDELAEISTQKIQGARNFLDWFLMIKNSAENFFDTQIFKSTEIFLHAENIEIVEEKISMPLEKVENLPLENIPAKLSVTEIKRRISEVEEEENFSPTMTKTPLIKRRPNFIQKKSLSSAELGTLMHSVMQHLDLKKNLDEKNISAQIDEMVTKKIFTEEHGEILKSKVAQISNFFKSRLGEKILSAKKIYRELPFNQYISAEKLGDGKIFQNVGGEKIFIQGIIDVLFQDSEGNWILLDYKTDKNNSDEHFKKEYHEQIKLYVQAVESLIGFKISEKFLYLLNAGREVKI